LASDNGHYGAQGLALRKAIRTWCGVEQGAGAKTAGFVRQAYPLCKEDILIFNTG
jgi:hypothetical protein